LVVVVVWAAFMNTKRKKGGSKVGKGWRERKNNGFGGGGGEHLHCIVVCLFMCYMVVVVRKNEVFCAAVKNSFFIDFGPHLCGDFFLFGEIVVVGECVCFLLLEFFELKINKFFFFVFLFIQTAQRTRSEGVIHHFVVFEFVHLF
jgi:hypothetical protein